MGTKSVGASTGLLFALECVRRGAVVSEPFGDDAAYDFVIDSSGTLYRVQVKGSSQNSAGAYQVNTWRRITCQGKNGKLSSKAVPYTPGDIDVLVTEVAGDWYIFDSPHLLSATTTLDPLKPTIGKKHALAKGAWHVISL